MFEFFSPEAYRAKGCLLSLLSSPGCRVGAGLTRCERHVCFEDLEGLLCCSRDPPVSLATNRKDIQVKAAPKCLIILVNSNVHTLSSLEKDYQETKQCRDKVAVNIYEYICSEAVLAHSAYTM